MSNETFVNMALCIILSGFVAMAVVEKVLNIQL